MVLRARLEGSICVCVSERERDMCSVAVEEEEREAIGRRAAYVCSCCRIVNCMCRLNGEGISNNTAKSSIGRAE